MHFIAPVLIDRVEFMGRGRRGIANSCYSHFSHAWREIKQNRGSHSSLQNNMPIGANALSLQWVPQQHICSGNTIHCGTHQDNTSIPTALAGVRLQLWEDGLPLVWQWPLHRVNCGHAICLCLSTYRLQTSLKEMPIHWMTEEWRAFAFLVSHWLYNKYLLWIHTEATVGIPIDIQHTELEFNECRYAIQLGVGEIQSREVVMKG